MTISIDCAYCDPKITILSATPPLGADEKKFRSAWKATTTGGPGNSSQLNNLECPSCGGHFRLADDGVHINEGGSVVAINISRPRIDSVDVSAGSALGGNRITLTGHALDCGELVVKFGEETANVISRSATTAYVSAPIGQYKFNILTGPYLKVTLSDATGEFVEREQLQTSQDKVAMIVKIDKNCVWIDGSSEDFPNGSSVFGTTSRVTANVVMSTTPQPFKGEIVEGSTSGALAIVSNTSPLEVKRPSRSFAPLEFVIGKSSDAVIRLTSSPAYSGMVDVTVENEFGSRTKGHRLSGGFVYT